MNVAHRATGLAMRCKALSDACAMGVRAAGVLALSLAGCYKATVLPQSEGHIVTPTAKPVLDNVPPPARISNFVPPPKPAFKPLTYSVVVNEVPVKELLFALARDTRQNVDIHPDVQGLVTLNAINETLPAILDRIAKQVNLRYRIEGNTITISADTPYMKTYRVNYVNMSRETTSTIGVSGQIQSGASTSGGTGAGGATGGQASDTNASQTIVQTKSNNNFWVLLGENILAILASTRSQALTAEDRAQRAETARAVREERLQQAEAAARAGPGATQLFNTAFGATTPPPPPPGDVRNNVAINQVTGTISVMATEKQHALIQQYIDSITQSSQRQVLIEATIAEVTLSDAYQAGVDWSRLAVSGGITFQQSLFGSPGPSSPPIPSPAFAIGYTNPTSAIGNIAAAVRLLNQFGSTRVLSSPKLMALNNQTALLKVVDNIVYFSVTASTTATANVAAITTFSTTTHTVPIGVVMSLTPQINENGQVTLTVRPTITRVLNFVNDPNPSLAAANVVSPVPQVQTREMESVLQLVSGQTAILGGLMQDNTRRDRNAIPLVGDIPVVGEAFGSRNDNYTKTELVIFLRSTIVNNPSLDSDELQFYRRFLPHQIETPTAAVPDEKSRAPR